VTSAAAAVAAARIARGYKRRLLPQTPGDTSLRTNNILLTCISVKYFITGGLGKGL